MFSTLKNKVDSLVTSVSVPCSQQITSFTKGIKFVPNSVSETMDLANGGYNKFGGFHRNFGGHSLSDLKMWNRFGVKFPIEVGKDSLTSNGIPLPGVETIARSGKLTTGTIQKWGCMNVGDIAAGTIAGVDSAINLWKFTKSNEDFYKRSNHIMFKGVVKITVAAVHTNPFLMVAGICDIGLSITSKLHKHIEIDLSDMTFGQPSLSF